MNTAFFYHQDCTLHDMGSGHPESPARIEAIRERLEHAGMLGEMQQFQPNEADRKYITNVHPDLYVKQLEEMDPGKGRVMVDPDTALMKDSIHAAYLAAGAAVEATDAVMSGQVDTAFCAVRPPGHHAERSKTMGFCFFNNIAIAARHAMDFHNLERVAIIDFDVHQGNGTIDIFQDDPRVLVCSSFEYPLYPYSHFNVDRPNIINSPLEAYSKGLQFRRTVERDWFARLQDHKPQLILISAGFDAHKDDPLAHLELEEKDYRWVTNMVMDVARMYSRGRVVSMLEGGYNLKALAASVEAHLTAFLEK
ncbi:deacetylase [Hahella sp. CCB-MM4]|uniref:histone deacetylase family protein n=1 Tax=Hahella sp. (strain CCB-MM4) TaxID=1926491 RepID=UPI000B9AB2DA|nr:histone deacetylase family protein [Hahella sp. CCB-MM4]OZG73769.1 deacetylase [Hahella sp. CCB-MM4]